MNLAFSALIPDNPPPDPQTLKTAVTLDPGNAVLHHTLGVALLLHNDVDGATASIERSLELAADESQAHCSRGQIHLLRNELDDAKASFERAISLDPADVDAHTHLAVVLILLGRAWEAAGMLRRRLQGRADAPLLWANLAAALRMEGDAESAVAAYREALALKPSLVTVRGDLAGTLFECGRFSEAAAERRCIAELLPSAQSLNDLGAALYAAGDLEGALAAYERAMELRPDWHVPLQNAATAACALHDATRASALLRRALVADPEFTAGHFDLGMMSMQLGDYTEGLREYEWRWPHNGASFHRPELQVPLWDGTPLAGRSLLLWCEQGFGDMLQFVRFVPRIPKDGGRIVLHAPQKLRALLATCEGVDQVVVDDEWLEADLQFPLLSLPFILGVTADTLAATAYLRAPVPSAAAERRIPCEESALNVGCVWASGTTYKRHWKRDCDVHSMIALASVPGVQLYSLQFGPRAADAETYADRITDLSDDLGDFGTTAAFVERLDLVITVDTAMAHLAGALGKPVWLLLEKNAEWRWMDDRSDSPWYPTMRIYRQSSEGHWAGVFERVSADLRNLASGRGCTRPAPPPLDPRTIPQTVFVKQYGERRTGTNLLRMLLMANYHTEVLMHILGDKHSPPVPFDDYWNEAQCEPSPARTFTCRATFSAPSATTSALSLSQIAEARRFEVPIAGAFARDELRFVISIRDPYAWAASLGWFLDWAQRGEPLPDECAEELRIACLHFNQRYESWLALAERLPSRTFFVRYEDLVADPEAVCTRLAQACGLARRSRRWRTPEQRVLPAFWDNDPEPRLGGKFESVNDRERACRSYLSAACREVVAQTIDWTLVERINGRASAADPGKLTATGAPLFERPVFVMAPPRSGTTVLFDLLAQAPGLWSIGGESHGIIEGITRLQPRQRGWESSRLMAEDADPVTVRRLHTEFLAALRDRDGNRPAERAGLRLLEKTPRNCLRVPFLDAAFPDGRFIYLYREPRETVSSMLDAWRSGEFLSFPELPGWPGPPWSLLLVPGWRELAGRELVEVVAQQWAAATTCLLDDLEALPPERRCVVRYDRLIAEPQAEMERLCAWIGVEWDRKVAAPLPHTRTVLTAPEPEKWRRNAVELERVMPLIESAAGRSRQFASRS